MWCHIIILVCQMLLLTDFSRASSKPVEGSEQNPFLIDCDVAGLGKRVSLFFDFNSKPSNSEEHKKRGLQVIKETVMREQVPFDIMDSRISYEEGERCEFREIERLRKLTKNYKNSEKVLSTFENIILYKIESKKNQMNNYYFAISFVYPGREQSLSFTDTLRVGSKFQVNWISDNKSLESKRCGRAINFKLSYNTQGDWGFVIQRLDILPEYFQQKLITINGGPFFGRVQSINRGIILPSNVFKQISNKEIGNIGTLVLYFNSATFEGLRVTRSLDAKGLLISEDPSLNDDEIILGDSFIFSLRWIFSNQIVTLCRKLDIETGRPEMIIFQNHTLEPLPFQVLESLNGAAAEEDHASARPHIVGVCLGTILAICGGYLYWLWRIDSRRSYLE